jgi:hypothetical protein
VETGMIILDTNSFSSVFDSADSDYSEFCFILQWVVKQEHACFVYGGTKYKSEIKKMVKYLRLINELRKTGKVVEINGNMIDNYAVHLKEICTDKAFNDEHLVAILDVSGCKLLCTKDIEAMPYIKQKRFYSDQKTPQIYSGSRNRNLLNATYIVELKNRC